MVGIKARTANPPAGDGPAVTVPPGLDYGSASRGALPFRDPCLGSAAGVDDFDAQRSTVESDSDRDGSVAGVPDDVGECLPGSSPEQDFRKNGSKSRGSYRK